jgi:hypothetical protein
VGIVIRKCRSREDIIVAWVPLAAVGDPLGRLSENGLKRKRRWVKNYDWLSMRRFRFDEDELANVNHFKALKALGWLNCVGKDEDDREVYAFFI